MQGPSRVQLPVVWAEAGSILPQGAHVVGKDRASPAAMAEQPGSFCLPAQLPRARHGQPRASHAGAHTEDIEHSQKNGMRISAGLGNVAVGKTH